MNAKSVLLSRINDMIATRLQPFGTTIFTEMTLLAQKHGAVNLAQGFPDFDGPSFIFDAAIAAMRSGQNQYARMFGLPPLNRAISNAWQRDTSSAIDPDTQVTVTSGCTEAIAAAILGLVNPGDEVILFEPFYDSYRASVAMAGGVPKFVTLHAPDTAHPDEFWFDPEQLAGAFTDRTRAILINTPHNPTGKVFTRAELELVARLCVKHNVIALADEVYEHLVYEPSRPHIHLATLEGMAERNVTMSSLGKTFSLTGWKIGWAIAPPELTRAVRAAHQFLTFATATPLQVGAAAAIEPGGPGEAYVRELVSDLRRKREFLGAALAHLGFRVHQPHGSYFIMADWSGVPAARGSEDDGAFCRSLTAQAKVAAIPPGVFYQNRALGKTLARFAFCKRDEVLAEAVDRLEHWAFSARS